jgi:hypothetical protein
MGKGKDVFVRECRTEKMGFCPMNGKTYLGKPRHTMNAKKVEVNLNKDKGMVNG